MAQFFPSLKLGLVNSLWFDPGNFPAIADEEELLKEEKAYEAHVKQEVEEGKNITPFGKSKEKGAELVEEEDEEEEEEDDIDEDDDDEFDIGSAEESADEEMFGI